MKNQMNKFNADFFLSSFTEFNGIQWGETNIWTEEKKLYNFNYWINNNVHGSQYIRWMTINVVVAEKLRIWNLYIFYVRNLKKVMKEIFGHLKGKQFNTYIDHLLHSLLLLTKFFLHYRLCYHCEYILYLFLLMQFFIWKFCNWKTFLKTVFSTLDCFLSFTIHIRMYLPCAN